MEKYLNVKEVASIFDVTDQTIKNWIYKGEIEAIRLGMKYLISESSLQHFIETKQVKNQK